MTQGEKRTWYVVVVALVYSLAEVYCGLRGWRYAIMNVFGFVAFISGICAPRREAHDAPPENPS